MFLHEVTVEVVRVAVIGAGLMGCKHASIYAQLPFTKLVALADADKERMKAASERFNVPGYTSAEALMDDGDFDAVSICVPDDDHIEPALLAASRGKHILVEKPLATTVEGAEKIVKACEEAGVHLMVGNVLRFDVRSALVADAVWAGRIGKIRQAWAHRHTTAGGRAYYEKHTTLPFHLAVHEIDLMSWLLQANVVRVFSEAFLGLDLSPHCIVTTLRFSNGVVAGMQHSWVLPSAYVGIPCADMGFIGTKGAIKISFDDRGLTICEEDRAHNPDTSHSPVVNQRVQGALREEIAHFAQSVLRNTPPLITGPDGLMAVQVAAAIATSIREERPISIGAN